MEMTKALPKVGNHQETFTYLLKYQFELKIDPRAQLEVCTSSSNSSPPAPNLLLSWKLTFNKLLAFKHIEKIKT
jgi:hypothetical protein